MLKISKQTREAAANICSKQDLKDAARSGELDSSFITQALEAFRRETLDEAKAVVMDQALNTAFDLQKAALVIARSNIEALKENTDDQQHD